MTPGEPRVSPESLESLPAPIDTASTGSCASEPEAPSGIRQSWPRRASASNGGPATAPAAALHYRRAAERPFTAEERDRVTILIGGLTTRHEQLIQAMLGGRAATAASRCRFPT